MNFNSLHALAATIIPQQSMEWVRFKESSEAHTWPVSQNQ